MPRKNIKAFTLIEMLFTLVIFVLLCGAVFGLITVMLTTTSSLQDNQNRSDQVAALNAFLKRNLVNLPASGVFVSYRRGDGDGLSNTGVITGQGANLMAIDAIRQANGYYMLRLARFSPGSLNAQVSPLLAFENAVESNSDSLDWRPLIHDVSHVDWRFQDVTATQWVDQWFVAQQKPSVAELSIQQVGDLQPAVMDFWIPNLTPPPVVIAMPTTP